MDAGQRIEALPRSHKQIPSGLFQLSVLTEPQAIPSAFCGSVFCRQGMATNFKDYWTRRLSKPDRVSGFLLYPWVL